MRRKTQQQYLALAKKSSINCAPKQRQRSNALMLAQLATGHAVVADGKDLISRSAFPNDEPHMKSMIEVPQSAGLN